MSDIYRSIYLICTRWTSLEFLRNRLNTLTTYARFDRKYIINYIRVSIINWYYVRVLLSICSKESFIKLGILDYIRILVSLQFFISYRATLFLIYIDWWRVIVLVPISLSIFILIFLKIITSFKNPEKRFSCERQDFQFVNQNIRIWILRSFQTMRIRVLKQKIYNSNSFDHQLVIASFSYHSLCTHAYHIEIIRTCCRSRCALSNDVVKTFFEALLR